MKYTNKESFMSFLNDINEAREKRIKLSQLEVEKNKRRGYYSDYQRRVIKNLYNKNIITKNEFERGVSSYNFFKKEKNKIAKPETKSNIINKVLNFFKILNF